MERKYNKEALNNLKALYKEHGIDIVDMDDPDAPLQRMAAILSKVMGLTYGCSFLSMEGADPLTTKQIDEISLACLENDYLDRIGLYDLKFV